MSDPMPIVARLRNLAVDEARRALADCVTKEARAAYTGLSAAFPSLEFRPV